MKVLVDSSLLIEYEKGNKTELLERILGSTHEVYINPIVFSEYAYQLLGVIGGRSPMSICESSKIAETLSQHDTENFLSSFSILPVSEEAVKVALEMMKKHNLLPNDALILAACKLEKIDILASYDADLSRACQVEGVKMVSSVKDFA